MNARRGSATIEFALCLPVLLVVIAGIVDISNFVALTQLTSRAVRDGARIGSTVIEGDAPTGALIEQAALDQVDLLLEEAGYPCGAGCDVTAEWRAIDDVMYVQVRVTYPYEPLVGLSTFLADNAMSEFTMMTQQQD
jgi:Flp pilus assembly protein TadG